MAGQFHRDIRRYNGSHNQQITHSSQADRPTTWVKEELLKSSGQESSFFDV